MRVPSATPDRTPPTTRGRQSPRERNAARRTAELEAERRRRRQRTHLWTGLGVVALVVIPVVATVAIQSARTDSSAATVPTNTAQGTDGTGFGVGSPDAPVTVDVYAHYLCPACRAFETDAASTLERLGADEEVLVRYRPVAILDRLSDDEYSTRAASAAAVVGDAAGAEAFLAFNNLLFARQPADGGPGLTDDDLIPLAGRAGAAGEDVATGSAASASDYGLRADADQASRDGADRHAMGPRRRHSAASADGRDTGGRRRGCSPLTAGLRRRVDGPAPLYRFVCGE
jgi:protein-disulfide isomerase